MSRAKRASNPSKPRIDRTWQNLGAIEIFVAVAEAGGLTAAAKRLGLSQSAVSQAISSLEVSFGRPLLDRSVRPPRLTLAGSVLVTRATPLLKAIREASDAMSAGFNGQRPILRIGMVNTFAVLAGPYLLKELADVAARWSIGSSLQEVSIAGVADRAVDLAITTDRPNGQAVSEFPIVSEPYILAVPGKAPRDWTTIARLRKQSTFIGYKPDSFIGRDIGSYLHAQKLELPTHHEFDSSASVLSMVRAGVGWAITTPLSVLSNFSDATDVRYHQIIDPPRPRQLAVFSADKHNDQLYQRVAQSARNVLARHHRERLEQLCPWWDWEQAGLLEMPN